MVQCVTVCCGVLQCGAVWCSVMQCVAACTAVCGVPFLMNSWIQSRYESFEKSMDRILAVDEPAIVPWNSGCTVKGSVQNLQVLVGAVCCSISQCVVVCCNVLQGVSCTVKGSVQILQVLIHVKIRGAVCYSVLQCVAVCCSVLQCVAVCCSVLHCVSKPAIVPGDAGCTAKGWVNLPVRTVAVYCSVLLCSALLCSVLQCVACNMLQCVAEPAIVPWNSGCIVKGSVQDLQVLMGAVCCSVSQCVLQCVAVCCSVLQCVALCCSVLCIAV